MPSRKKTEKAVNKKKPRKAVSKKQSRKAEKNHNDPLLPSWLPPIIIERAPNLLKMSQTEAVVFPSESPPVYIPRESSHYHDRLVALLTDERMKSIWPKFEKELYKVFKGKIMPSELDNWVALHFPSILEAAVYSDQRLTWHRSIPGKTEWKKRAKAIREHASKLRELLDDGLSREPTTLEQATREWQARTFTSWNLLNTAIRKCALDHDPKLMPLIDSRIEATRDRHWSTNGMGQSAPRPKTLGAGALLGDLREELELLEGLAARAMDPPPSWSVNKSPNHGIRVYVIELFECLNNMRLSPRANEDDVKGFPLYSIIATMTNIALKLTGEDTLTRKTVVAILRKHNSKS